jgi:hypothetical protein
MNREVLLEDFREHTMVINCHAVRLCAIREIHVATSLLVR